MNETTNAVQARESAMRMIAGINAVEGFCPEALAEDWQGRDGKVIKGLPVLAQVAWFRLRYPEGRISVRVAPDQNGFVAHARVYRSCEDADEQYLAEAVALRQPMEDRKEISPREWAQTAAIGLALRNAGFGLQFRLAGDPEGPETLSAVSATPVAADPVQEQPVAVSAADPLQAALDTPCIIKKYAGRTMGEVMKLDPGAISWIAKQAEQFPEAAAAARLICEYALEQTA